MFIQGLVDILVKKIQTKEINPTTGLPFTTEDIKIAEYKIEVERILDLEQETPTVI